MIVWWNQWFSTAYHLINLMRDPDIPLHVIGSSRNPDCVYKMVCDEWFTEPSFSNTDDYVDFCLRFCKEHKVEVFVPRHNLTQIVQHKTDFDCIGTKLFANTDIQSVSLSDDKTATYQFVSENGLSEIIPEYYLCKSIEDFRNAFDLLNDHGYKVCYKLAIDEGATTYHVIENERNYSIYKSSSSHVSYEESVSIIEKYHFNIPLLVMPYLAEPEISVDCLKTESSLIAIPRYKKGNRISEIIYNEDILRITDKLSAAFRFDMPYNIQFRFLDNKPMLLELNPRMSGGLQLSCKASGINIPKLALFKLLGCNIPQELPPKVSKKVAHIETPIIIE